MKEHSEHTPRSLTPILLTTKQAEAYVGKEAVLDYLRKTHGLQPLFTNIGLGGRASLWHRPTIDQHLLQLSVQNKPIEIQPKNTSCQENTEPNRSKPKPPAKPTK